ncbi:MAG TPA: S9 family peptidase [bacterium]|nr:S9 family peptidase [bacterium]
MLSEAARSRIDDLIGTITSLSGPADPQLSPDGRHVAYVRIPFAWEGDYAAGDIWVAPADGSAPARQFTRGNARDDSPRWSPDGRALAFLSDRLNRGARSLYRISPDGGEALLLVRREAQGIERFAWSPDGSRIAFTAPDEPTDEDRRRTRERDDADVYGERWRCARLYVLDLARGAVVRWDTEERHVVDLAWAPDGRAIAVLAAPTPEGEVRHRMELLIASADGTPLKRVGSVGGAQALTWSQALSAILWLGSHSGGPQSAFTVFAVDVARAPDDRGAGTLGAIQPRLVGPGPDDGCCAVALAHVAGDARVVVALAEGLTTRLEWLDARTGTREVLWEAPDGEIHEFSAVVHNGSPLLAVVQSSGSAPPEVHVGTPGALVPVSCHHAPISAWSFGRQEPFYWTAADGIALDGVLIRPVGGSPGPWPTIVLIHGGPYHGRAGNGFHLSWGQLLAMLGYAVLFPNYRGGMGHGERFAAAVRGNIGGPDFVDVMTAVDAAVARGIADERRLGIGGWSQGGFMTAWAVTQTDRFRAGVMGAGISHWGSEVLTSDLPTFEGTLAGDRPWDGPDARRGDLRSPITYAKNVRTPLLILHGKADERIPVGQATGFERAMRKNGVPVQLVTYPREPHGVRERNHQRDLLRRMVLWFDRWLA